MFTLPALLTTHPITTLLGVSTIALGLALGWQTYRIEGYKADVAEARQHEAEAKQVSDQINALYARNEAKNERARAEQAAKNAEELRTLGTQKDALQAVYEQTKTDYAKTSDRLRGILKDAPNSDKRELGPAVRAYFAGLRDAQRGPGPASGPTPP